MDGNSAVFLSINLFVYIINCVYILAFHVCNIVGCVEKRSQGYVFVPHLFCFISTVYVDLFLHLVCISQLLQTESPEDK